MNRNFKRKLIAGLFVPVLGLATGTALAQTSTAPTTNSGNAGTTAAAPAKGSMQWDKATFDRLDKNRDGNISRDEAHADPMLKDSWTKLDAGNKGMVSRAEFEDYGRKLNPNSANPSAAPFSGSAPK